MWGLQNAIHPSGQGKIGERLWQMVLDGTIDTIASDHSPHSFEKKTPKDGNFWTISEGCTGVQTLLPVMVTEGRKRGLTWTRLVNLCAANPAKDSD
ncbi:hypothetical protein [Acetomicrobium sp.]|uniref:hypothetical protein n=1 Tax=Acetomicrobium sp. TaxID=1872099 RepID=UPI002FCAE154